MILYAIDPGTISFGWAQFEDGILKACGMGSTDAKLRGEAKGDVCVVEVPQVYARAKSRGDPNDLVALAFKAGMLAHLFGREIELVKPRQWKGTIPKTKKVEAYIIHKRNMAALPPLQAARYAEDLSRIAPYLRHNVADAVGIGLWFFKKSSAL